MDCMMTSMCIGAGTMYIISRIVKYIYLSPSLRFILILSLFLSPSLFPCLHTHDPDLLPYVVRVYEPVGEETEGKQRDMNNERKRPAGKESREEEGQNGKRQRKRGPIP